jgi:signal transduction histidine kinase
MRVDPQRILNLIQRILGNAVRFTGNVQRGGGLIHMFQQIKYTSSHGTIAVKISLLKANPEELFLDSEVIGKVCVAVTDSGVGLSAEEQERIFHRFDENKLEGGGEKHFLCFQDSLNEY